MTRLALDTSAAVPLVVRSHPSHRFVGQHVRGREIVLTGHSLAETYSVLTRLPGDARLDPQDAVRLIASNFGEAVLVEADVARDLPSLLANYEIRGGAVYDAIVALAAHGAGVPLLTRDRRALSTYSTIGVQCELIDEDPESIE